MDFKELTRQIDNYGKSYASYWGNALAGEVGEACNLIKKYERDGLDIKTKLGEELADVFIYLELTARHFGLDLEKEIIKKLAVLKERRRT